ncbi:hypothetical protein CIG75_13465 [Tumebacillus algifaecis]|uniref:DUF881 domain-containing protein n=1 Tax=Tumebacillus algifaecis TaxID=1214604 RepID=A0A223D353_9BACL|nr:DUF881 domain-containing protein [Tumebacillus algifaecis]ASS75863.1 hypothetical protein CIG75_13465 [Tumebacillus algifaecis]
MKLNSKISLVLVAALLGWMMTVQFTSINRPKLESSPAGDTLQLTTELKQETERQQFLRSQIREIEQKIADLQSQKGNQSQLVRTLAEELERVKNQAGMSEVKGSGIIVTIEDDFDLIAVKNPEELDMNRRSLGDYLYRVVNYLKGNEAKAIVVNNHRIVSFSSVRTIDSNNLQVNTVMVSPDKIIIKAVGNVEQMKVGMSIFPPSFAEMGKKFTVQEVGDGSLVIPPYDDDSVQYEYAHPEGEKKL